MTAASTVDPNWTAQEAQALLASADFNLAHGSLSIDPVPLVGGYEETEQGSVTFPANEPSAYFDDSLAANATYQIYSGYVYNGSNPQLRVFDSSGYLQQTTTTNGVLAFTPAVAGTYYVEISSTNVTGAISRYVLKSAMMSSLPSSSGDTNINALLGGGRQWWHAAGSGAQIGTTAVSPSASGLTPASSLHSLTYSFLTAPPSGASITDSTGFAEMDAAMQSFAQAAFAYYGSILNVTFTEVASGGDIQLGTNDQGAGSAGYSTLPQSPVGTCTVYLNNQSATNADSGLTQGSYGWETLLHEIGHSLGLKHPGNYNAAGDGTAPGPYLPTATDNRRYSIMSYNDPANVGTVTVTPLVNNSYSFSLNQVVNPQGLMLYDIEALQYLYGANTAPHDQTYSFKTSDTPFETIWAPSGVNTIDCSQETYQNAIDLRAGDFSSIGMRLTTADLRAAIPSYATDPRITTPTYDGSNDLAIAYGSHVDVAIGGSNNDSFYANSESDRIDGGAGTNTVYLFNTVADWRFTSRNGNVIATDLRNTSIVDTLINIQDVGFYGASSLATVFLSSLVTTDVPLLTATDFAALTTTQIGALTKDQFGSWSSTQWGWLAATQFEALSATQLGALSPNQIRGLSATELDALSASQIVGLSSTGLGVLSAAQIREVTPDALGALSVTQLAGLGKVALGALTASQIQGLSTTELGALSPAQLRSLGAAQVAALSATQIAGLGPAVLGALSGAQLRAFSTTDIAALTVTQFRALSASQLGALSSSQIQGLAATDIAALSAKQFQGLNSPAGLGVLTATQLAVLSTAELALAQAPALAGLSAVQFRGLTATQLGVLTAGQLQRLSKTELGALTAAQIGGLSAKQLGWLTAGQLQGLSTDALAALSPPQFAELNGRNEIRDLSASQLGALNTAYIGLIAPNTLRMLTTAEFAGLTAPEIGALTTRQVRDLAMNEIKALDHTQLAAFTPTQIAAMFKAEKSVFLLALG